MGGKAQAKKWAMPVIIVLLLCVVGVLVMQLIKKPAAVPGADAPADPGSSSLRIGYAEGTVAMDEKSLQDAINDLYDKTEEGRIALSYKNDAVSSDGETFACYIRNSPRNTYDQFIGIYADAQYTDQLYLSGLIRPGDGFESITLDHALPAGSNKVFVVYTQVKESDGEQVMCGQAAVTMNFIVRE